MSGQGADEVFGGYFWYKKIMDEKILMILIHFQNIILIDHMIITKQL